MDHAIDRVHAAAANADYDNIYIVGRFLGSLEIKRGLGRKGISVSVALIPTATRWVWCPWHVLRYLVTKDRPLIFLSFICVWRLSSPISPWLGGHVAFVCII
ncbi:hypothetical protein KDH_60160 [Dictyobacter sp. S3.2.2.5]|uniref:Uncharacterized protein n=1 Tax=Dictyobacter halimunensis TaxID=3026934 RepID=A0ABQ6FZE5_9CHLR|nr:hypothetical protein KDH_60160 [Dictyobacter sp. S3.2.2.5]